VALYTYAPANVLVAEGNDMMVGRQYLMVLTGKNLKTFNAEKARLAAANQKLNGARSHALQLVTAEAGALQAQAEAASRPTPTSPLPVGPNAPAPPGSPAVLAGATPAPALPVADGSPAIMGRMLLSPAELASWLASTGRQVRTTVPLAELTAAYQAAGVLEGVKADIAFAQSIVETAYFGFPTGGQVAPADNNFAGIGACDSCPHGFTYPDAKTGAVAQLQLLHAYAVKGAPTPLFGQIRVSGCCSTWMALSGVWATATHYGYTILNVYRRMLEWAINDRTRAAGL
jgi:hypothetical protein